MGNARTGRHFAPSANEADITTASQVTGPTPQVTTGPAPAPKAGNGPAQAGGASGHPSAPINPLVAAREAAGTGPIASSARPKTVDQLYYIEGQPAAAGVPGKSFDTSFASKRSKKKVLLTVLIVLVVLVLAAVAAFFIVRGQVRASATENINAAIQRISDADVVIVPLDEAIGSEITSSDMSGELTNVMMSSTTASNALTDAASLAKEAGSMSFLLTDEQQQVIDAINDSVAARRSMLEIGRALLAVDAPVSDAIESLDAAFASIAAANAKVQQSQDTYIAYADAVSQGLDTSGIDLWANVEVDNQAVTDITNAQASVAAAKESFPDADYTALENYLATRLVELQINVQYDTAVANGDEEGANALIDQLNEAAAASSTAASTLPAASRDVLRDAYAQATSGQSEEYEQARTQCVESDEVIRDYLGVDAEDGGLSIDGETSDGVSASIADASVTDTATTQAPASAASDAVPADTTAAGDATLAEAPVVDATTDATADPAAQPTGEEAQAA